MAWEPWDDPYTKFAYDPSYPFKELNKLVATLPDPDKQAMDDLLLQDKQLQVEENQRNRDKRTQLEQALAGLSLDEALPVAQQMALQSGEIGQSVNLGNYINSMESSEEKRQDDRRRRQMETELTMALRGASPEDADKIALNIFGKHGAFDKQFDILKFQESKRAAREREEDRDNPRSGSGGSRASKIVYYDDPSTGESVPLDENNPVHRELILSNKLQRTPKSNSNAEVLGALLGESEKKKSEPGLFSSFFSKSPTTSTDGPPVVQKPNPAPKNVVPLKKKTQPSGVEQR